MTDIHRPEELIQIPHGLGPEDLKKLHYFLKLTQGFEDRLISLYKQGKIVGGVYTSRGNEAVAVGTAFALEARDVLCPMHRDLGAALVKGDPLRELMCQFLARGNSPTRGKDSNLHHGNRERNTLGMISHLGTMIPVTVGAALAEKMSGSGAVALTYIGDGGSSIGDFHEGLNFAAVQRLPFILVIENNQYAFSTPNHMQFVCERLADRALGYGIPGVQVDGTDVLAVYQATKKAVERGRRGEGPTLIETITMRLRGHSEADNFSYVPKELIEAWQAKEPVSRFENALLQRGVLKEADVQAIEERIAAELEDAAQFALDSPMADPEEAARGVFAP
ncbi:MAG: thiamine pyrophosphate-dependent dehydrogenase E1 component subunit alpha [Planctomycetota bacterium]